MTSARLAGQPSPADTERLSGTREPGPAGGTERFDSLFPRVVQRVVGEGEAADQALQSGGFVLNESVVVMRLNEETDTLEFFCDVGQPLPQLLESTYRTALELNLCRTYPGVSFGVHPESSRLVATMAMHMLLVADDEVCLNALEMLTGLARQLREERVFLVEV
jgi:hypothetical protein